MQGMGRIGDRMVGEEGLTVCVGQDEEKSVPRFVPQKPPGRRKRAKNKTAKRRPPPEKNKIKVISAC